VAAGPVPRGVARAADAALEASVVASFGRPGYLVRRALYGWGPPASDGAGRVAVVTGASSGIGRAVAESLVRSRWSVVAVSRDPGRNAACVDELRAIAAGDRDAGRVTGAVADLSDLGEVRELGSALRAEHVRLDALVHDAGVLHRTFHRTDQGFEATFALHVLGPTLLSALLLDLLRAAGASGAGSRVVTVSSGGMYPSRLDLERLEHAAPASYHGAVAYSLAKRAQVELGVEWARRLARTGVVALTMHPGWVATRSLDAGLPAFAQAARGLLRSPEQGADTAIWLACAPREEVAGGGFYLDRRPRALHLAPWTRTTAVERSRALDRVATLAGADVPSATGR